MKRANILKPQNTFEKKIDNFESGPWKPLLTSKPHAQTPLDASLTISVNDEGRPQYVQHTRFYSKQNADF